MKLKVVLPLSALSFICIPMTAAAPYYTKSLCLVFKKKLFIYLFICLSLSKKKCWVLSSSITNDKVDDIHQTTEGNGAKRTTKQTTIQYESLHFHLLFKENPFYSPLKPPISQQQQQIV